MRAIIKGTRVTPEQASRASGGGGKMDKPMKASVPPEAGRTRKKGMMKGNMPKKGM